MLRRPPRSTLFPYTTLFRSLAQVVRRLGGEAVIVESAKRVLPREPEPLGEALGEALRRDGLEVVVGRRVDRKSTRLNSSHVSISYAVFCLKKKKKGR